MTRVRYNNNNNDHNNNNNVSVFVKTYRRAVATHSIEKHEKERTGMNNTPRRSDGLKIVNLNFPVMYYIPCMAVIFHRRASGELFIRIH